MQVITYSAQFATLNSIAAEDVDADGHTDLLLAVNGYQADAGTGRYDASNGLLPNADSKAAFVAVVPVQSGLLLMGM